MNTLHFLIKHIRLTLANSSLEKDLIILYYTYYGEVDIRKTSIYFVELGIESDKELAVPIITNYNLAKRLKHISKAIFSIENQKLFCSIQGIKVEIQIPEEIFILHEIWVDGTYNYNIPNASNIVLVDIGMNVGYASLYFAARDEVNKVYSFEPFKPTFMQGKVNLSLNPTLAKKIIPQEFGLSEEDQIIEVDYSPMYKGRIGIWGTNLILEKISDTRKEKLELKNFNEILTNILSENKGKLFVLKIDCEGSEYDIFKNLDMHLLKSVTCIMMEWHRNGPEYLNRKLIDAGFKTMVFNPKSKKVGMLYAFK